MLGGTVRPSALAVLRLMISEIFRRPLHREVGRIGAPEDAVDVGCRPLRQFALVEPVGQQHASP